LPKVPIYFYQGSDDETVDSNHLNLYRNKFKLAKFKMIKGADHQINNDLSDVSIDIKTL
jgi:hypothetical protein